MIYYLLCSYKKKLFTLLLLLQILKLFIGIKISVYIVFSLVNGCTYNTSVMDATITIHFYTFFIL